MIQIFNLSKEEDFAKREETLKPKSLPKQMSVLIPVCKLL